MFQKDRASIKREFCNSFDTYVTHSSVAEYFIHSVEWVDRVFQSSSKQQFDNQFFDRDPTGDLNGVLKSFFAQGVSIFILVRSKGPLPVCQKTTSFSFFRAHFHSCSFFFWAVELLKLRYPISAVNFQVDRSICHLAGQQHQKCSCRSVGSGKRKFGKKANRKKQSTNWIV